MCKHFLDSLSVVEAIPALADEPMVIDVGSGAGFPGLPLKIVRPSIRLTLLEATAKKTAFLNHIVEQLGLEKVTVLTARAETVGQQPIYREQYDVALARAVAALPILVEYVLPLVKVGGLAILQKGQYPADELGAAAGALEKLGGAVSQTLPVMIPGLSAARHLIILSKRQATPAIYPRRPGVPAKKPLQD